MTFTATRSRATARPARGGMLREMFAATIMLAGLAGCGSLVYGLLHALPADEPAPGTEAVLEQPWADIARPMQIFSLQSPEFGREPRVYEARRHKAGGRQDVLTYGADFGQGPMLRLSAYRVGSEAQAGAPFFVDLARQAAQAGLSITRSAQPVPLASKFGSFETADVLLEAGSRSAACVAFRLEARDLAFRMSGFACGEGRAPDRASLSCVLDRLDLVSGSGDPQLLRFFTAAEQARGRTCAPKPAGSRTSWLDPAGRAPPLRNGTQLARIQP